MGTTQRTVATVDSRRRYEIICTARHTETYSIRCNGEPVEGCFHTLPEALRALADIVEEP